MTKRTCWSDAVMTTVFAALVRDFLPWIPPSVDVGALLALSGTVDGRKLRNLELHQDDWADDATSQKRLFQLQSLLKRYRFKQDLFTEDDLELAAIRSFLLNQDRLAALSEPSVPTRALLLRARFICQSILGEYSEDRMVECCSMGSRATLGVPLARACEGEKWSLPLSGTPAEHTWFAGYLLQDAPAAKYVAELTSQEASPSACHVVDALTLSLVPKTFKSLRSIVPNTTIGSFRSKGLGKVIMERLKEAGYNIRTLQQRHRELAREASVTGQLVTADQRAASDNITTWLCSSVLPERWFRELSLGRAKHLDLGPVRVELNTFALMGIGFTFPLQTLIFLCLLRAIADTYLPGRRLTISVYGDDMIYDRALHPYVVQVFPRLGLQLNADKTFCDGRFRESCGGDFYAGVDVRPFNPMNGQTDAETPNERAAFLHKTINGLRRRWWDSEIPTSLAVLYQELSSVGAPVLRVPMDASDESGVKVPDYRDEPYPGLNYEPIRCNLHGQITYIYLRRESGRARVQTSESPYLWRSLGSAANGPGEDPDYSRPSHPPPSAILRDIEDSVGVGRDRPGALSLRPAEYQPRTYRGLPGSESGRGRRLVKKDAFRALLGGTGGRLKRERGLTVMWDPKC